MSIYRDYSAGDLVGRPTTREQQLALRANFVRCAACGDPERGRENYLPMAASGTCAWCGWGNSA